MLPKFNTEDTTLSLLQTSWSEQLNPLIRNAANKSSILQQVQLSVGDNIVNHKLGRKLQGWSLIRKRGAAEVYDKQDTNRMQDLTLVLNSTASVIVDIEVF